MDPNTLKNDNLMRSLKRRESMEQPKRIYIYIKCRVGKERKPIDLRIQSLKDLRNNDVNIVIN